MTVKKGVHDLQIILCSIRITNSFYFPFINKSSFNRSGWSQDHKSICCKHPLQHGVMKSKMELKPVGKNNITPIFVYLKFILILKLCKVLSYLLLIFVKIISMQAKWVISTISHAFCKSDFNYEIYVSYDRLHWLSVYFWPTHSTLVFAKILKSLELFTNDFYQN